MAFEMRKADEHIGIYEGPAYLGLLHILPTDDIYFNFIRSLKAIRDDDMTAGGIRHESILVCAVQMIEGVLSSSDIQRVAVGKEGSAPQLLDHLNYGRCIVRPEKCKISRLSEVHLHGGELVGKIDGFNACLLDQPLEFVQA